MKCKDCGNPLDMFGLCPNTDPKEAAKMSAPVYCGKTPAQITRRLYQILNEIQPEAV